MANYYHTVNFIFLSHFSAEKLISFIFGMELAYFITLSVNNLILHIIDVRAYQLRKDYFQDCFLVGRK